MDRREFLQTLAAASVCASVPVSDATVVGRRARKPPAKPRIGFFVASESIATWRGAELSVDESARAAQLFGGSVTLTRGNSLPSTQTTPGMLKVILGGETLDSARRLAAIARDSHALYMNVGCHDDALRGECIREAFHIAPSEWMRQRALMAVGGDASTHEARAWDSSLARFGADTLNRRFMARYGVAMTAEAWTAWCAVKCVWDAALRSGAETPAGVIGFLERDARFDAHKGAALFFDGQHQLLQPLYVVPALAPGRVVAEAAIDTFTASPRGCAWTSP
jgi:hypothetical protein